LLSRRAFSRAFAATVASASVASVAACAPTPAAPLAGAGTNTSFGALKQVDAGVLNIGYAEAGPANGPVVLLLHGWPYDIHSYVDVAPILASSGYRVIVPYLRGYGTTTFLSKDTFRNAQQSAVAALKIQKAILGGFDWGGRTACIMAALWPERCKALVSVSGYLLTNLQTQLQPAPPSTELAWWYEFYFSTDRGLRGYQQNTHDFNKLIWKIVSPKWNFDDATYDRTAASFGNPDHVSIVIHNYRWRLSLAKGEPRYDGFEQKLSGSPVITVPTITIASDFDGAAADGTAYRNKFSGKYAHRVLQGIGHNVPQEDPRSFAQAIVDVDRY
jgi:pimeloyl-ACP methyl ester carboxylesterase